MSSQIHPFEGFGGELLHNVRESANARIEDAVIAERIDGIRKTVQAMKEAKISNQRIISLLQKHWDLRLSEATHFVEE